MTPTSAKSSKTTLFALGFIVLIALAGFYGYSVFFKKSDGSRSGAVIPPANFTLFYTCDTRGHIEPCRCSTGMAGGISRRWAYITANSPHPYLLLDAGDVNAGSRAWEILEVEYILRGYEKMGYHAVNIGHRELSLGPEGLVKMKGKYSRFVSANVLDAQGEPIFEPYRVVQITENYRAGIIGVVDDQLPPEAAGKGLNVIPPEDALAKYLPELKKQSDLIVLLAFTDEDDMKALADRFFEIDFIVGGNVTQPSGTPVKTNHSDIVFITDKGKALGRLDLTLRPDGSWDNTNDIVMLKESMTADAEIEALVQEFRKALEEHDFQPHKDDDENLSSITATRSKTANRYVGAEKCKDCHPEAYRIWAESGHAHAFERLVEKDSQFSPRCLKCHTVGYMASDGYINQKLTPDLKNVQCETCHGRGAYEVKLRNGEEIPVKKHLMKSVKCAECHNSEFGPNFEQVSYWKKIEHGVE